MNRNGMYDRRVWRTALGAALLLASACASSEPGAPLPRTLAAYSAAGPYRFATGDAEWIDAARHLAIRARIYYPADDARHPLVIFSHGLANSRLGYRYLGEHWASWGFISVHVEHPGAGEDLMRRGWMATYRAGFDKRLWSSTPADVSFVIDQLLSPEQTPPFLRGHIDDHAIGVAGHSLGAYVALAESGAIPAMNPGDKRIRAAIAMSMSENLPPKDYGTTNVPILHFTGTSDSSLFYGTTKRMRRIPFETIRGAEQLLVTIRGANHSTFSADDRSATEQRLSMIKAVTTLWWKAWLEDDVEARQLLSSADLAGELRPLAVVERNHRE
jgi:predicted dienelactone hydrolase